VPEADVGMLPPSVDGLDVIELGCGTAYVSSWLARRGARPVGIDNSPAQLETARRLRAEFGVEFPLHLGNAEQTAFSDESFDLAIPEYGASIWCDPYLWIPEAARILRPGGRLVFLVNGAILMLCAPDAEDEPATDRLLRDYFGMHRFEWPDDPSVEFHLGYGDMIRLLRRCGFEVEDMLEVRPREDATTSHPYAPVESARRWPAEEVWKALKRTR
jgi:SAM-dependent methyltransferase